MIQVVAYTLYHSSNAYLGHFLAERALRDLPVELVRRPLHVPKGRGIWVSDLVGGRASPRQGDYNRDDCLRWAARHGIEVNDEAVVRRACETAGLESDAVLRRAFEPDATQLLEEALTEFDRLECPGTPTFVVEGERFWGKDRVDWLLDAVRRRLG